MLDVRSELIPGLLLFIWLLIGGLLRTAESAELVPSKLSPAQQSAVVDKHNMLRRQENASNIQHMVWNDPIASMAQTWANTCKWAHGNLNATGLRYDKLGQNIFLIKGFGKFSVDAAITAWYNEKTDYNYDALSCNKGKMCGHYTQVVWASSIQVGCGLTNCSVLNRPNAVNLTNATLFVCNYGPAGNIVGKSPYIKGKPCTRCESGVFNCHQGLCVDDCNKAGVPCTCQAQCENCGKQNTNCTCSCVSGWMGVACHEKCRDLDSSCMSSWTQQYCSTPMVSEKCPAMCKVCDVQDACTQPSPTPSPLVPGVPARLPSGDECFCLNGGSKTSANNTKCKCSCMEEYHGRFCQYLRQETALGVTLFITANKTQWPAIKKAIDPIIVKELIRLCYLSQNTCCPDASKTWLKTALGYPTDLGMPNNHFRATVYAFYAVSDPSCVKEKGNRTKRADDSQDNIVYVPQDRLLEAITNVQPNMEKQMEKCCHAKLDDVKAARVDDEDGHHGNTLFGLPIWAVGVIAVGCLIAIFLFIMVMVIACRRKKNTPRSSQRNDDMETTVNL